MNDTTTPTEPDPSRPTGPPAHTTHDAELTERCTSHAQWLAGILAAAQLDTLTRPDRLPADLHPELPADQVDALLRRGIAIGMAAERLAARPHFHRDTLARHQAALAAAGYTAMARLTARTLNTLTPTHPADPGPHHARGGHE